MSVMLCDVFLLSSLIQSSMGCQAVLAVAILRLII